ncbi:HTH-type transcriptional regulator MalT [Celerinatantimonas yamalensis]|uniref:HTH-type transcriptional regulator MalT n=1 Tax=Celerinatantimonas yamalensis TaxID=559956 RepID=A0ABW9G917_9GAMM
MLLPSKLSRPKQLKNVVSRARLLHHLDEAARYQLVLVMGPAGYGKTTLVAQWAEKQDHIGWFTIDERDNQLDSFADYFIEAIQKATHGFCKRSSSLTQKNQYANLVGLFSQLIVELSQWSESVYMVIDDYHLIDNQYIHEAMQFLLKHQPDNLTLIILSRHLPSLGVANLRVREQLLEIDSQQLSFTHEEARQFFDYRLCGQVANEHSDRLCDEVSGWVTALQLIVISSHQTELSDERDGRALSGIQANHLSSYLNDEVLSWVDYKTRQFLLRCSILHSMNHYLINCVTEEEFGQQLLEHIERQGLFVQRIDDGEQWFCFHPLFANFLRQRCQWEYPDQLPKWHRYAAEGWLHLGYPSEAIYHALASHDQALLLSILEQYGWSLFHQSELQLLDKCMQALTDEQRMSRPSMLLLQAWLAQSQHRAGEVGKLLVDAKNHVLELKSDRELKGQFAAIHAQLSVNTGHLDEALQLAHQALDELNVNDYFNRIVAISVTAEVLHCQGQLDKALAMMRQCEQMAMEHGVFHNGLWSLIQQSEILIAKGMLQQAFDVQEQAFELIEAQHLHQLPLHEFVCRLRSQLLWSWGHLDDAEKAARKGLDVMTHYPPKQQLQCLAMLAKCALARGDLDNARTFLSRCENLLNRGDYHTDWVTNTDKARVIYWQMVDDKLAAQRWLDGNAPDDGADNHFLQGKWRNIARAHILLEQYTQAQTILSKLNECARQLQLTCDINRNLLLLNLLHDKQGLRAQAQDDLIEALNLACRTGFISHFVIEGEVMAKQLRQLLQLDVLEPLAMQRAQSILRQINQYYRHKFAHFDENFVTRLLEHPNVPELIRISPLTQREWQVLGLIYSGYSNEQIAQELNVAATTIKTHIRNLYQKLDVNHRREAVSQAHYFLEVMGYAS